MITKIQKIINEDKYKRGQRGNWDSYRQDVSAVRDDVYAGNVITAGGIEVMLSNMRNAYNDKRAVKAADWQTNVCHASCHSSCHGSRGRR